MNSLTNNLIKNGDLKSDLLISAFSDISRMEFVPIELELQSDQDVALPIGFGRTLTKPSVAALIFELLDPQIGQKILIIQSGSGWEASILALAVGSTGRIIAIDRIADLVNIGAKNADKFNFVKNGTLKFFCADGVDGYKAEAPYDRILILAEYYEVPQKIKEQVVVGGKIVMIIKGNLTYIEKEAEDKFNQEVFAGFHFPALSMKDYNALNDI